MRSQAARALVTGAALVTAMLVVPVPVATADDAVAVRLYSATFNGKGKVELPGDGQTFRPYVEVDSYNPAIFDDECSAVVVVGVAAPEVVRCSFYYRGEFTPSPIWYCTGEAVSTGIFVVFPPGIPPVTFNFVGMRAVIDEATVHAVGTQYVDPGTGNIATGYAQFDFGDSKCDKRVTNFGRVLY